VLIIYLIKQLQLIKFLKYIYNFINVEIIFYIYYKGNDDIFVFVKPKYNIIKSYKININN